jgi:tetratricopeptide (TPR) repeat protein
MAWKYEQEWRLLLPSGNPGLRKVGTVKEIRFGERCVDLNAELMKSHCWDSSIKIYKAVLDTDQEKVIFQEWDPSIQAFPATKPVPRQISTINDDVTKEAELEGVSFFSMGNKNYSEGNYTRAITNFTESLRLNTNFTLALMARGGAYYRMGDFEKAVIDLSKAVMLEPHNALAKTTLEKANAALNNTSHNAEYFFNSGNVYCEKGDYRQAIMDWNKAIKIKPDYADAFYNRGFAYGNL